MITDLTYSVTFPTNNLSLSGSFTLDKGLVAVTGDNGTGKTFGLSEMPRYMLFGKKALRGPASDYKNLDGDMGFEINGAAFRVRRNRKKEELLDAAGNVLAVGAEAVNKRIVEELGYGLEVFDVANSAVQKQTDRLSQLRPAERKRLIDEVVGLTANEEVEKACKDEAKGLRREAEAMRDMLVPVVEPVKPERYRASLELQAELAAARATAQRVAALQQIINSVGAEPAPPPLVPYDVKELEAHEQERMRIDAELRALRLQWQSIPDPVHDAAALDTAERREEVRQELQRRGPRPVIGLEEAEAGLAAWAHYNATAALPDLDVTCPSCHHEFNTRPADAVKPEHPASFYREQRERAERWPDDGPQLPDGRDLNKADIRAGRLALERAEEKATLQARIVEATSLPDRSDDLHRCRQLGAAWAVYTDQHAAWATRSASAELAAKELAALPSPPDVNALQEEYTAARVYEAALATFEEAKAKHDELAEKIGDTARRAEEYKAGGDALSRARARVKAHLAPSLSRVASALIYQMTGGKLSTVFVDDEMNIAVDGQEISTLSGAGSTVANLALRIALGQVLVHNRLPLFIADEADADMSASRAQLTLECLANLRDQISQIVVISHKQISVQVDQEISFTG